MSLTAAKELVHRFLPEAVPKQPTLLLESEVIPCQAAYLGFFGDSHVMVVNNHPFFGAPQLTKDMHKAHELVHQAQAENLGEEALFGFRFSDYLSPDELNPSKPDDFLRKYSHIVHQRNIRLELAGFLLEGMARMGEMMILERMARQGNGDLKRIDILQREIVAERRSYRRNPTHSFNQPNIPYVVGYRLVRALVRGKPPEAAIDTLLKVDYTACRRIQFGSSGFDQILKRPSLIPTREAPQAA